MFGFYVIKADMDDTLMDEIYPFRNRMQNTKVNTKRTSFIIPSKTWSS